MDDYMIKACGNRLIVKKLEEKPTPGQLILPNQGESSFAYVLAVGDKVGPNVAKGDSVILQTRAGFPFSFEGVELHSILEQEIVAIVPPVKPEEEMNG